MKRKTKEKVDDLIAATAETIMWKHESDPGMIYAHSTVEMEKALAELISARAKMR